MEEGDDDDEDEEGESEAANLTLASTLASILFSDSPAYPASLLQQLRGSSSLLRLRLNISQVRSGTDYPGCYVSGGGLSMAF